MGYDAIPPSSASALISAIRWIEELLLGSVGTIIAVVAVGLTGFALLTGRIDLAKGARVVLGCFILFGAPLIAQGLSEATGNMSGGSAAEVGSPPPPAPPPPKQPPPFDPYAGASVPM